MPNRCTTSSTSQLGSGFCQVDSAESNVRSYADSALNIMIIIKDTFLSQRPILLILLNIIIIMATFLPQRVVLEDDGHTRKLAYNYKEDGIGRLDKFDWLLHTFNIELEYF